MISLEQAKELVQLLEHGQQGEANRLLTDVYESANNPMLKEIGMLTRDLHESLKNFHIDNRFSEIATDEIPDARERLQYVIQKTEVAANKTMDAVDRCMPIADQLHDSLLQIRPEWNSLMNGRIELMHFKSLCHRIDGLLSQVEGDSTQLRGELTEILMAQDFQDLTGQIIKRVIKLVNEVENRLVEILMVFGAAQKEQQADKTTVASTEAEGPIINPEERVDAVSSQDEVDDLLSSLGF
ncbi:chemotaxis response - phosphatase CheZ [Vibrio sp. RC586]|uniref:protein phosphatase CheZ n=1 Tax=Vibrio sp. RC586 TaxID=675815 RepID=UPI0001BB806E|nr:protein phosphatase CheZ [Vibrio sp. RC586]EEY98587.1 chemotaxis response - phosphatase CheZ [Vibrio sp. RC586]